MAGDEFGEGAVGLQGGVSSFSPETSQAGIDILRSGGNAVDAAVATAFAVGVAEPQHSGIGGCGMMTVYLKESDEYITLEYLETVPAAQYPGLFQKNTDSKTAKNAAVPGQVFGLLSALEKYGSMTPAQVLAPAIRLAREGFELDPIVARYYGYDVVTSPPPSMGGDWLLEMLNIMELKDIASKPQGSVEYWRIFNEANRICMSDTYACAGDPAFFSLPVERMISKAYAAQRAGLIGETGTLEVIPECDLRAERLVPAAPEDANTTHIAVIDRFGNIVSATETIGNTWGCKTAAKGLSFWLNSHISNMDHTDPENADYIMPGKRVRSTISPTIVVKDGVPVMALGSPGSLVIPPAIACVINNVLLYGMDLQEAINAPRALCIGMYQNGGASLDMTAESGRIDPAVMEGLKAAGYLPKENVGDYDQSLGGVAAVCRDENGVLYAGADHRRTYKALAY